MCGSGQGALNGGQKQQMGGGGGGGGGGAAAGIGASTHAVQLLEYYGGLDSSQLMLAASAMVQAQKKSHKSTMYKFAAQAQIRKKCCFCIYIVLANSAVCMLRVLAQSTVHVYIYIQYSQNIYIQYSQKVLYIMSAASAAAQAQLRKKELSSAFCIGYVLGADFRGR